jgi:hypothetical protein
VEQLAPETKRRRWRGAAEQSLTLFFAGSLAKNEPGFAAFHRSPRAGVPLRIQKKLPKCFHFGRFGYYKQTSLLHKEGVASVRFGELNERR